jgi:D-Tyr-tRNAtyr deacylase
MRKMQNAKSLGLMIILTISLAVLPMLLHDSLTSVKTGMRPNLLEYVYGEQAESAEEVYLKFVSEVQQQSDNSNSSVTTTNNTTMQVPNAAKGPTIPTDKGYLVQEIGEDLYSVSDGSYNTMFVHF